MTEATKHKHTEVNYANNRKYSELFFFFFWSETLITISNSESDEHLTSKYLLAHTLLIIYISVSN